MFRFNGEAGNWYNFTPHQVFFFIYQKLIYVLVKKLWSNLSLAKYLSIKTIKVLVIFVFIALLNVILTCWMLFCLVECYFTLLNVIFLHRVFFRHYCWHHHYNYYYHHYYHLLCIFYYTIVPAFCQCLLVDGFSAIKNNFIGRVSCTDFLICCPKTRPMKLFLTMPRPSASRRFILFSFILINICFFPLLTENKTFKWNE